MRIPNLQGAGIPGNCVLRAVIQEEASRVCPVDGLLRSDWGKLIDLNHIRSMPMHKYYLQILYLDCGQFRQPGPAWNAFSITLATSL